MDTVKCETCLWSGTEDVLVDVPEDAASGIYYKGCPHCWDDVGLVDIEEEATAIGQCPTCKQTVDIDTHECKED